MAQKRITDLSVASALTGVENIEVSQLSTTVKIVATTISALASDNSFNDSANGFVAAGFDVGDRVKVAGFTGDTANNLNVGTITALTTGKMTIGGTDGDVIVDDTAGESVTITKWTSRKTTAQAIADLSSGGGGGSADYPDFTGNANKFLAVNVAEDGVEWDTPPITDWTRTSVTATGGQTDFAATYLVGYVQVFINGVLLAETDYTATDGETVVLANAATAGDIVDILGTSAGSAKVPLGTEVNVPASANWRIRFPESSRAAQLGTTFGVGISELKWLDDDLVTQLATGGVATASANIPAAGPFDIAELYDGSTANGNGWYSGTTVAASYNAWCGYQFATAVRPAAISLAPLYSYADSFPLAIVVEFLDENNIWQPIATFYTSVASNNTYQTFELPTTYMKVPPSGGPNLWAGAGIAAIGDSITEQTPGGVNWVTELRKTLSAAAGPTDGVSGSTMAGVAARITAMDLTNTDTLLIFMGTNDYGNSGGRALGAFGDNGSSGTFYGDVYGAIYAAFTAKPTLRLVFATPIQRTDTTATNGQGKVLKDYVDAIIDSCGRYSVPVFDAYRKAGFNSINFGTYSTDGLHPGAAGHRRFARGFSGFLIGI